ncbi:hypothetical protein DC3_09770 [Deinococcus cellulosilyticus NBRC 106333 = KACC 11606]|uniref:Uncharacterized protein n=1 Tax=Deinococcus cellulosilyticus (strain DSM 18568 / NBRC 106333 / KACC 11606 / 5516J-15) TaxID=1223518 RepID=A0A511MXL4_DEIC1|nr:hypothetical protein DC3_09770 [Deinococcus cellulosilyticus NBRC 106333 = KACC 11606]
MGKVNLQEPMIPVPCQKRGWGDMGKSDRGQKEDVGAGRWLTPLLTGIWMVLIRQPTKKGWARNPSP